MTGQGIFLLQTLTINKVREKDNKFLPSVEMTNKELFVQALVDNFHDLLLWFAYEQKLLSLLYNKRYVQ